MSWLADASALRRNVALAAETKSTEQINSELRDWRASMAKTLGVEVCEHGRAKVCCESCRGDG